MITKVWDDIFFVGVFELHQNLLSCSVKIYEIVELDQSEGHHTYSTDLGATDNITEASIVIEGFVKWDNCSNFSIPDCIHFCSKAQAARLGILMERIYDEAANLLPKCLK